MKFQKSILGLARISLGLIFLWAFFDKVFGFGFATTKDAAWINGGSPTTGFLLYATKGPFAGLFTMMAGNIFVDILFMSGLFLIGISLVLGIFNKLAGYSGALLMILMWLAVLPPEHHPFLDEHIIYGLLLLYLAHADSSFSFRNRWKKNRFVKRNSFFE